MLEICGVRNKKLLDIGTGSLSIIAAKKFDCLVTNIDIYKKNLTDELEKIQESNLQNEIELDLADATTLPYKRNYFDIVTSYGALHHNPKEKRKAFIEEIYRVASEKICVAEFKETTFPHKKDVHKPVNLNRLKEKMRELGEIKSYKGKEMILIICKCKKGL